ncbi:PAS domain-containing protein [Streptomyces olivochromogenes]|uniref:PAS domain-containing protein n=1 Tax=Streptomyces olivochromogenes TaxID=1963 RepID=UPI001F456AF1|nr:PAS domain-containing protein [Streptomyces olivochromogenes]MCF3128953.1 PAS domain-containing protein [Streptomyces olivochromogenes]
MDASDELLRVADPAALLTLAGTIAGINAAMAKALGKPTQHCLGDDFAELWPAGQRLSVERLVTHAARTTAVAMRVLEFSGRGGASVARLFEARQVKDPAGDEQLVFLHALDTRNVLASLLIPFRLATKSADLGLWMYDRAGTGWTSAATRTTPS